MAEKYYKNELEKMYSQIYSSKGRCKCFDECSKNMPNGKEINCCKLKLGNDYGKSIPKIMFVGKEGVSPNPQVLNPINILETDNDNYHYFATIHTLAYLLGKIDENEFLNIEFINKNKLSKFNKLSAKMCLTNYYKCAFRNDDKNHDINTNDVMGKNCPIILTNEIDVLKPNIIIMQGKFSSAKFWGKRNGTLLKICNHIDTLINIKKYGICISADKYIYNSTKEPLYIVWGYHPCAHGRKWYNTLPAFKEVLDKVLIELK